MTKDGELVKDRHGDIIPPDVLEKAAYKFTRTSGVGGLQHRVMNVATLVESCFVTPEKLKSMGISDPLYKGAGWWCGFFVQDSSVWDAITKGELPMFSIGGEGTFEEIN